MFKFRLLVVDILDEDCDGGFGGPSMWLARVHCLNLYYVRLHTVRLANVSNSVKKHLQ